MDDTEDVLAVERQWVEAHLRGDWVTIELLMDEDYVKILPNGSLIGKAGVPATLRGGQRSWEYAAGDEYDVRVYGDTAVVIGRWRARGVSNDQSFDYAARFLSVYARRGRWLMVAEQSTEISTPSADQ